MNENECSSCGCHYMQTCYCTPLQIKEAQDDHKATWQGKNIVSKTLKEILDEIKNKDNKTKSEVEDD